MFRKDKSIFKPEKKSIAIERITTSIIMGASNSSIMVANLNFIVKNPRDDAIELTDNWSNKMLLNHYLLIDPSYELDLKIKLSIEEHFFDYFFSLLPFFFMSKKIKVRTLEGSRAFKWTNEDYHDLKLECFKRWIATREEFFDRKHIDKYIDWHSNSLKRSERLQTSFFNRDKEIDRLIHDPLLYQTLLKGRIEPLNFNEITTWRMLAERIKNKIYLSMVKMDDDFYEMGNLLHRFFKWS